MPWAGVDPGASRNACAVAAIDRDALGRWGPIYLRELRPPRQGWPLDIRNELVPLAREVRALGCASWASDGWAVHDVLHAGMDGGLSFVPAEKDSAEHWRHLLAICARDLHALGPSPLVSQEMLDELVEQLAAVQEAYDNGRRVIRIPEVGGLHGDLATAYARAFWHARAADYTEPRGPADVSELGGLSRTAGGAWTARGSAERGGWSSSRRIARG